MSKPNTRWQQIPQERLCSGYSGKCSTTAKRVNSSEEFSQEFHNTKHWAQKLEAKALVVAWGGGNHKP